MLKDLVNRNIHLIFVRNLKTNIMKPKKFYKDVIEEMVVLQISNKAISEPIIKAMKPYIVFKDEEKEIKDLIYSGMVFDEIKDTIKKELEKDSLTIPLTTIPLKYFKELKMLSKLAKKYNYIMVIDNP
jgi:hypothetical protein